MSRGVPTPQESLTGRLSDLEEGPWFLYLGLPPSEMPASGGHSRDGILKGNINSHLKCGGESRRMQNASQ